MAVQVIRAKRPSAQSANSAESAKLKVAAYCRVSTDMEEQESSYEAQCTHYTNYIESNPDWEMAGIYADEGLSGTQAKKRPEFLRMIKDCEKGKINLVLTKSISRFARNTLDCLTYIRQLKEMDIAVFFEKENINTLDAKGEVLITIMASIAQQESQSISQNVTMGIRYKMQEGKGRLNTTFFMGFKKDPVSGKLVPVAEEADIVRRIYREFLEGYSKQMICDHLMADGIKTPEGKDTWFASTVGSMLENEKYAGDVLLQKSYTTDFLTHKKVKNTGKLPQYYVEDDHDPIVPKPVYFQVQGELMRRGALKNDPTKIRFGSREALFGRLVCGQCGRTLKRYTTPDLNATDWRCRKRAYEKRSPYKENPAQCGCPNVPERVVKDAILEAFNLLPEYRDRLIRMQAQIENGELKRIDALVEKSKKAEMKMEERRLKLESQYGDTPCDEIAYLEQQIEEEQQNRNALILERADHANREVHIRLLLELVDEMKEADDRHHAMITSAYRTMVDPRAAALPLEAQPVEEDEAEVLPAACTDYDDFFRRTRWHLPDDLLDFSGRITRFDNDMVIRYLDTVTVNEHDFAINFKAGFSITIA